ncbi:MAG: hypothetical protein KDB04_10115 [Acidimicrobiales bacterium]|nr:hypothetical protein [Acidimicrobiales bacterium]HRW37656.1 hypothetical protein [Aquihabitans sp.]
MSARRMAMRSTGIGGVALLVLLSGGCGSEPVDGPGDSAPPAAEWTTQRIDGEQGADRELQLGTWDDEVMIVGVTEDDELWSSSGRAGTRFAPTEPMATDVTYLSLGGTARLGNRWLTIGSGGLAEVDGDGELQFEPHAFRFGDAAAWEEVPVTGFSGPMEVQELVARGDRWVAVGNLRDRDDPASGGVEAAAWWSTDGEAWHEVVLPVDGQESVAADVAVVGDRLLAVGHDDASAALWSSADGGETWARIADPVLDDATGLGSVQASGDTVLVTGTPALESEEDEMEAPLVLLRSTDGGGTWSTPSTPPPTKGVEPWLPLEGSGPFLTTTSLYLEGWRQPEACYADIDRCRMDSVEALYASADGDRWARVDTSTLGEGEVGEVRAIDTTAEGAVVAITWDDGLRVSTWPAAVDLPTMAEPSEPEADVTLLAEGDEPELGVRYAQPLGIHCGMDWLFFGGEPWQRTDDGPDVETGAGDAPDPGWPVAQQTIFGFATLTDDGVVEYSIGDGEVIATYERATEDPPGCS